MNNFVHGYATHVPGTWMPCPPRQRQLRITSKPAPTRDCTLLCGNTNCYALCDGAWETERRAGATRADLARQECSVCAEHRRLRARVRVHADDKRHYELRLHTCIRTTSLVTMRCYCVQCNLQAPSDAFCYGCRRRTSLTKALIHTLQQTPWTDDDGSGYCTQTTRPEE